jgi:hypothetical protein
MKRLACLIALIASSAACAQEPQTGQRGAYVSAALGNGRIDGADAGDYRLMRWRAFEARAGRDLSPAIFGEDSLATARSTARIDFVYYNEGHPDNNHRDGFAFQLVVTRKFGESLTAEVGAGPYTSMNTTTIGGVQYDSARRGMLYSAALLFPLPGVDPGTHVRLGFNHVWMRDTFQSNAIVLGIGRHFTDVPPFPDTDFARSRLWLGASYGSSITSMSNTHGARGTILQAKQYGGAVLVRAAGDRALGGVGRLRPLHCREPARQQPHRRAWPDHPAVRAQLRRPHQGLLRLPPGEVVPGNERPRPVPPGRDAHLPLVS